MNNKETKPEIYFVMDKIRESAKKEQGRKIRRHLERTRQYYNEMRSLSIDDPKRSKKYSRSYQKFRRELEKIVGKDSRFLPKIVEEVNEKYKELGIDKNDVARYSNEFLLSAEEYSKRIVSSLGEDFHDVYFKKMEKEREEGQIIQPKLILTKTETKEISDSKALEESNSLKTKIDTGKDVNANNETARRYQKNHDSLETFKRNVEAFKRTGNVNFYDQVMKEAYLLHDSLSRDTFYNLISEAKVDSKSQTRREVCDAFRLDKSIAEFESLLKQVEEKENTLDGFEKRETDICKSQLQAKNKGVNLQNGIYDEVGFLAQSYIGNQPPTSFRMDFGGLNRQRLDILCRYIKKENMPLVYDSIMKNYQYVTDEQAKIEAEDYFQREVIGIYMNKGNYDLTNMSKEVRAILRKEVGDKVFHFENVKSIERDEIDRAAESIYQQRKQEFEEVSAFKRLMGKVQQPTMEQAKAEVSEVINSVENPDSSLVDSVSRTR